MKNCHILSSEQKVRILFLHALSEADKKTIPHYFNALEKTIKDVSRFNTEVAIETMSNAVLKKSEALFWYAHPRVVEEMCFKAKKAEKEGFDAVIIGCVGAVEAEYALKEILNIPIVGASESGFLLALLLGVNFSILTYHDKSYGWLYRTVRQYGLQDKCVSIRQAAISMNALLGRGSQKKSFQSILKQAKLAVEHDRAEVLLLGSVGFVGLADYLRKKVDPPVVDPVEASIKFAEILIDLNKSKGILHSKILTYKPSPNITKFLQY